MTERVDAYAAALIGVATGENRLPQVEDDLFRFARTYEGSDALQQALTDPNLPVERRIAVVEELTGGKALPVSVALISMIVAAGRAHDLAAIVDRFVELAAETRRHEVAEVRSAIPLDDAQRDALAAALSRATNKDVEIKVIVDPTVLGGLIARVGDTVIDGSVRHRLDQLREQV